MQSEVEEEKATLNPFAGQQTLVQAFRKKFDEKQNLIEKMKYGLRRATQVE